MLDPICSQSAQSLVVEPRDVFARHAEELLIARYWPGIADRDFQWPATGTTLEECRAEEGIVARVGGVIVGRAILQSAFYPLAEFVNLEVAPAYRGRGVGGAILHHTVERAARAGFLAIHAQTRLSNLAAHRLYGRQGFLPAARGEMLRVWRFLNLPALAQFLCDHPMASFESNASARPREHLLHWHDPLSQDELAITISGGSCQLDSESIGPGVSTLLLRSGAVCLEATLELNQPAVVDRSFEVRLTLTNHGSQESAGGFRLGLNQGFRITSEHAGGEQFTLSAGASLERSLTIQIEPSFPDELLRICSYESVPVTVDLLLSDHTFWLAAQVVIRKQEDARGEG